jgi:O-glycosyl hydrolase
MKRKFNGKIILMFLILGIHMSGTSSCKKKNDGSGEPSPTPDSSIKATVSIDRSIKLQTIDGFGFFGGRNVWWGNASTLYSDAWAKTVIEDLGITIWRTELYPPATVNIPQDADFNKQVQTIEGLKKIADENKVPLKYIFSIWSPPADMKCAITSEGIPIPGTPHPGGTKNGGTLDPAKYTDFGNWIADGIQQFKDLGVEIYAFSPQNEPLFSQFFNSCRYNPVDVYPNMLKNVIPVVKSRFPAIKVFGSENMLEMEGGKDRQYFYNANLKTDSEALSQIDLLAVHGYSDGISPTGSAKLTNLWTTTRTEHFLPANKPYWMTETSGYGENWLGNSTQASGAFNLGMDIHAALYHGNISAWVWWQGSSEGPIDEFSLMQGETIRGKKYHVSKHFYRFIRPGSKMVKTTYSEADNLFVSAFENQGMNNFTVVLINNNAKSAVVKLEGTGLPADYDYYITSSLPTQNCTKSASRVNKDKVELAPYSIVTLVNGNVYEK